MRVYVVSSTRPDGSPCYFRGPAQWIGNAAKALQWLSAAKARAAAMYISQRPLLYCESRQLATPVVCQAHAIEVKELPPDSQRG